MRKPRKWKLWAICNHYPTDLFDAKRDAVYFQKQWQKSGTVIKVEVRELKRKAKR